MKKTRFLCAAVAAMLVLCSVFCFTACGSSDGDPVDVDNPKDIDVDTLAMSIFENCKFDDTALAVIDDSDFALTMYNVDPALVKGEEGAKEAAVYTSSASPEMIVCIKAADDASAQKIYDDSLAPFIESYIEGYSSYGPDQVPKLETAVVVIKYGVVVLAVSADNSATETYINGQVG